MRTTSSPGSIVSETSTTAGRASSRLSNRLLTWSNRISVAAFGAPASAWPWSSMAHRPYLSRGVEKSWWRAVGRYAYGYRPNQSSGRLLLDSSTSRRSGLAAEQPLLLEEGTGDVDRFQFLRTVDLPVQRRHGLVR